MKISLALSALALLACPATAVDLDLTKDCGAPFSAWCKIMRMTEPPCVPVAPKNEDFGHFSGLIDMRVNESEVVGNCRCR